MLDLNGLDIFLRLPPESSLAGMTASAADASFAAATANEILAASNGDAPDPAAHLLGNMSRRTLARDAGLMRKTAQAEEAIKTLGEYIMQTIVFTACASRTARRNGSVGVKLSHKDVEFVISELLQVDVVNCRKL